YATRALIYNWRARSPGEIFLLEGRMEDKRLKAEGVVQEYPGAASPRFRHRETGRWFVDETVLEPYAQCYDRDDIVQLGFMGMPATSGQVRSGPGRPIDAAWRSWTLDQVVDILRAGLEQAQEAYPDREDLSLEIVAAYTSYPRQYFSYFFRDH